MPALQQAGETVSPNDVSRSDYPSFMDGALDDFFPRSTGAGGEPLMNIVELLGLNMPRGSLMGSGGGGSGSASAACSPQGTVAGARGPDTHPLSQSAPSSSPFFMSFSGDDSGYQTSHPGSPLPHDMATPGKSSSGAVRGGGGAGARGRLDSAGTFPPQSPSPSPSPTTQGPGPFSPGTPDWRRPFEDRHLLHSRSNSPESDSSIGSVDNTNLSELMSRLYLHTRNRSDSGLSTGLSSNGDQRQQELTNLTNLHALQALANNNPNLYNYQHDQQLQSPVGSPLSSPLAPPDKAWSPGSLPNSMSGSLPGSPLCMSSPLRGPGPLTTPSTPPSPSSAPLNRMYYNLGVDQLRTQRLSGNGADNDPWSTWSGNLPARSFENATFSVFLGGVPWDITEPILQHGLRQFGMIRVEWPVSKQPGVPAPKGYAYIIMECEKQVKALLRSCRSNFSSGGGNWYFKISSKRMKAKDVQVIPWMISDTNWVRSPSQKLDPEKTVFVGGLHGMLSAHGLAVIMNDLFDGVVYAGIDTDKFKYPIGSARVTFNNNRSFFKAINARYVLIKTDQFSKKVQLLPYLEDSPCSICLVQHGPYFCRESSCFRYFCHSCWEWIHNAQGNLATHKHLTRSTKSVQFLEMKSTARRDLNRILVDGLQ
ncbi:Cytoplasmic polyadenylation element-binding protein 1-A [Frankliniella fusca]|uniref:Cytoplasmic polyadenylation element-binding protein 1-A n=1 Tax=Frankliniella fusca TaxID=407009 RepID=A0AAE1LQF5_9NEOP|nr:Cytoplasmic polyadenylation element-binding protein 1-A [Frankliniella fusca]